MITPSRLFRWLYWQWRMFILNIQSFNEGYNPYVRLAELKRSVDWLQNRLNHVSCTCGKPLAWDEAYGCIECEQCHLLAVVDIHHHCDVYLGNGHYWCRACVVSVVRAYELFPFDEDDPCDDALVDWVEGLPVGTFLERVEHAQHMEIFNAALVASCLASEKGYHNDL